MSGPAGLIEVRPNHRFDEGALDAYLRNNLEGYAGPSSVQQFEGGHSNPTFLLTAGDERFVLRKKPPGKLLPSAHQVDREYRIYRALKDCDVPVPHTYLLCEDDSVIGTSFFVMEYVEGRVFRDAMLADVSPAERKAIYADMNRVLAALHSVNYQSQGLGDYGKPGNYFARQIGRWTKQYLAARTDEIKSMDHLIEWLPAHAPDDDTTTIVHGDYDIYNLMFDHSQPRVMAVLDWELSTLGHPLADLAYTCMKYHTPVAERHAEPGDGIPTEEQFVAEYCKRTGIHSIDNWNFCLAFSFFRFASIIQGVYKRGLQGNASSAHALEMKDVVAKASDKGWELACR